MQAAERKLALAEREAELAQGKKEKQGWSQNTNHQQTLKQGKAKAEAGPARGKTSTERRVGRGGVQEKGEAEVGKQQNQQTLKSGKAEVGKESAKRESAAERRSMGKGEVQEKGEAEAEQTSEATDPEKWESRSGDRGSKKRNSF